MNDEHMRSATMIGTYICDISYICNIKKPQNNSIRMSLRCLIFNNRIIFSDLKLEIALSVKSSP